MFNPKTVTVALVAASLILTLGPAPTLAASGGRISGGSFRSSPSRSFSSPSRSSFGSSSRSYSAPRLSPSSSRSYSFSPPAPITRTYVERRAPNTSIIFLPDLSPRVVAPVAPVPPVLPVDPVAPVAPATSLQAPARALGSNTVVSPTPQPASPLLGLTLLLLLGTVGVALFLAVGGWDDFLAPFLESQKEKFRKISVARVQVALLSSAKDVQKDLEKMARSGSLTSTKYGLQRILSETSLALLRNPDKTVYARSEWLRRTASTAEELYNRMSIEERSKLSEEVLTNNKGQVTEKNKEKLSEDPGEYILVSLLVAYYSEVALPTVDSLESLRTTLTKLGSLQPDDLVALEILWQPEGKNEVLSQEELLSLYPQLNRL